MTEKKIDQLDLNLTNKIQVRISDFDHGLRVYDNVNMVRVVSESYNLLIMDDFISTVGVLNGSVEIVSDDDLVTLKNISGYYLNRHNVFTLLIDEEKKGKAS